MKIAVAAAVAAFMLTACGSGETFPMASDEGLSKIKELVAEHVDTSKYKIHTVEWREDNGDRQLENILTYIDVYYIDADNNNYHLAFQLTNGKFTTDGPERNDRQTNSYACSTPLDLAAIDFDYLQKIGEKADALVMSDEEGKTLTFPCLAGIVEQRRPLEPQRGVPRGVAADAGAVRTELRRRERVSRISGTLHRDELLHRRLHGRRCGRGCHRRLAKRKWDCWAAPRRLRERTPDDSLRPESPTSVAEHGLWPTTASYVVRTGILQRATIWPCAASM
jgi:hypothetical protein